MDTLLDTIKNGLKSLFGGNSISDAVGVDIGSSAIKVVHIKKEGEKAVLETYGALALGPYMQDGVIGQVVNPDLETIVKALKDIFAETKITSINVVLGIPSVSSIVFILQLPADIDEKALSTAIPIEAKKFIPVPLTDVSLDWYVIPEREDSGTESRVIAESGGEAKMSVLVVATLNETLAQRTEIMQKSNLPTDSLEIELFSNIRALLSRELFPVLIIDIGASKTKLTIVEHGIVQTFRLVNKGGQDMTTAISRSLEIPFAKAEQIKKEYGFAVSAEYPKLVDIMKLNYSLIGQEANTTILGYEKRYNKNVSKIIITGGGAMAKGLVPYFGEVFSAEVVLGDPFQKVEAPVFLTGILQTTGPEFSAAIGLALRRIQ